METITKKELRRRCEQEDHGLAGFYCTGELFVNTMSGVTIYNRYMEWDDAVELCDELGITLTEV